MEIVYAKVISLKKTGPRYKLDSQGYMKTMVDQVFKVNTYDTHLNKYRLYNTDKSNTYVFDGDDLVLMSEEELITDTQDFSTIEPLLFDINELNL